MCLFFIFVQSFDVMKVYLTIILSLFLFLSKAQEFGIQENDTIASGVLTFINDDEINFYNLYKEQDKLFYTNVTTGETEHVFTPSVKSIARKDPSLAQIENTKNETQEIDNQNTDNSLSDENFYNDYPEGVYESLDDFIHKKVNTSYTLEPRGLTGFVKPVLDTIEHTCFFYNKKTKYKVTKAFAISYKGELFFQIKSILKNRNRKDRSQSSNFVNSFVKVLKGGPNYLYTEANLANAWAQGFAYGAIGGVAGTSMAQDMVHGKGIVWDVKNKEFNIFRNCKDYNEFAQQVYPKGIQSCPKKQPDVLAIRKVIEKIK